MFRIFYCINISWRIILQQTRAKSILSHNSAYKRWQSTSNIHRLTSFVCNTSYHRNRKSNYFFCTPFEWNENIFLCRIFAKEAWMFILYYNCISLWWSKERSIIERLWVKRRASKLGNISQGSQPLLLLVHHMCVARASKPERLSSPIAELLLEWQSYRPFIARAIGKQSWANTPPISLFFIQTLNHNFLFIWNWFWNSNIPHRHTRRIE